MLNGSSWVLDLTVATQRACRNFMKLNWDFANCRVTFRDTFLCRNLLGIEIFLDQFLSSLYRFSVFFERSQRQELLSSREISTKIFLFLFTLCPIIYVSWFNKRSSNGRIQLCCKRDENEDLCASKRYHLLAFPFRLLRAFGLEWKQISFRSVSVYFQ